MGWWGVILERVVQEENFPQKLKKIMVMSKSRAIEFL